MIIANPPYLVDSERRQYRHGGYKMDGAQLAFDIVQQGVTHLYRNGHLFLSTGLPSVMVKAYYRNELKSGLKDNQNLHGAGRKSIRIFLVKNSNSHIIQVWAIAAIILCVHKIA